MTDHDTPLTLSEKQRKALITLLDAEEPIDLFYLNTGDVYSVGAVAAALVNKGLAAWFPDWPKLLITAAGRRALHQG
jgi:hypothetical protein